MTLVPLGRPRKPSALRVAEGMRGHRPLPEGEPKPRNVIPQMPEWFSPLQRWYWDNTVAAMNAVTGWITEEQTGLLRVYAEAMATWEEQTLRIRALEDFFAEHGHTLDHEQHYIDANGTPAMRKEPRLRPEVQLRKEARRAQKEARADVLRYSAALGLGPVFKARVNLSPTGEDENLDSVV